MANISLPASVLEQFMALGPNGLYVYLARVKVAEGSGEWFDTSTREIAEACYRSPSFVSRTIPTIAGCGLVERRMEYGSGTNPGMKVEYRLTGLPTKTAKAAPTSSLFEVDDDDPFDEWYAHYPRKEARVPAQKAFALALTKTDLATLIAKADEYAAVCKRRKTAKDKIKMPATWLNAGCWHDDYSEATNGRETTRGGTTYDL